MTGAAHSSSYTQLRKVQSMHNSRRFRKLVAGVGLASVLASPAMAQDIIPPKTFTTSPTGVNLADAAFTYSETDIAIGTLKLERFHIGSYSTDPNTMLFGNATTSNFDIYVSRRVVSPGDYRAIVHLGASASGTYFENSSGSVVAGNLDAESGTLTKVSGQYVYTDQSGTVYQFTSSVAPAGTPSGSQRVSSITFPDGRVQTFSYVSGNLKLVSDTSGYAMVFDYSSGRISAACGFDLAYDYVTASSTCSGAALATSYGYTGTRLTSATDVDGQTTAYTWGTYEISCITPPGYSTCKIANTLYGSQVSQQTLADGSVWTFSADMAAGAATEEGTNWTDGSFNSGMTDPNGKGTALTFTKSTPYSLTDPNGNTTQYRWTGAKEYFSTGPAMSEGSLMTEATLPEGNKYLATYAGPKNAVTKQTMQAKPGSGLADLELEFGYASSGTTPQNLTKPIWREDAKNNRTDYTYASHGGVTSEMQPAPSSGAARPLKLVTYVQEYAYVKNSGGTLVASATPVWLIDTETQCQTVTGSSPAATCDTGAPITVIAYEYGANGVADNLLLRGKVVTSGGVSLRTCFTYDTLGRKISETAPRGTTTSACQ
jgi:hypothetical protein